LFPLAILEKICPPERDSIRTGYVSKIGNTEEAFLERLRTRPGHSGFGEVMLLAQLSKALGCLLRRKISLRLSQQFITHHEFFNSR
jgi:hypothetical protein